MGRQLVVIERQLQGEHHVVGGELGAVVPEDAGAQLDLKAGVVLVERLGHLGGQGRELLAGDRVDLPQVVEADLMVAATHFDARGYTG